MNNTQDKNNPEETKDLDYYLGHIRYDMTNLIKWLVLAVLTGLTVGFISSLFARALKFVTNYRAENTWIFFLLPLSGLVIVFLYQKFGREDGGTTQVLSTIRSQDDVPFRSAPLIFVSTILTHLVGCLLYTSDSFFHRFHYKNLQTDWQTRNLDSAKYESILSCLPKPYSPEHSSHL